MKTLINAVALGAALSLSACGGSGDDALGDAAAEQGEANAEALEDAGLDAAAERTEDAGYAREDAIDAADVDADAMTPAQQNALVNGAMPVEAAPTN